MCHRGTLCSALGNCRRFALSGLRDAAATAGFNYTSRRTMSTITPSAPVKGDFHNSQFALMSGLNRICIIEELTDEMRREFLARP
jgi:hypothetical protein